MRKSFLAGLAILLPLVLTVIITMFFVNLLTRPFQGLLRSFIERFDFHYTAAPEVIFIASKILVLLFLALTLVLVGFLVNSFFLSALFNAGDRLLHRIPLINKIYHALQEVMKTLFATEKVSFRQVVLAPFPFKDSLCVGFLTNDKVPSDGKHKELVSVLIPAVPNPMQGFILLYRRDEVHFIDMPVDDALRYLVSCGVVYSGFSKS